MACNEDSPMNFYDVYGLRELVGQPGYIGGTVT